MIVVCQSVGAAGFASSTVTGVAAGATATGGLIGGLWPGDKKNETEASEETPKEPKDNEDNNEACIEETESGRPMKSDGWKTKTKRSTIPNSLKNETERIIR